MCASVRVTDQGGLSPPSIFCNPTGSTHPFVRPPALLPALRLEALHEGLTGLVVCGWPVPCHS